MTSEFPCPLCRGLQTHVGGCLQALANELKGTGIGKKSEKPIQKKANS